MPGSVDVPDRIEAGRVDLVGELLDLASVALDLGLADRASSQRSTSRAAAWSWTFSARSGALSLIALAVWTVRPETPTAAAAWSRDLHPERVVAICHHPLRVALPLCGIAAQLAPSLLVLGLEQRQRVRCGASASPRASST